MTHTFSEGQLVQLTDEARGIVPRSRSNPDDPPRYVERFQYFGPGPFDVRGIMPVAPCDQLHAGHHQRIKIGSPGAPDWKSHWFSAEWFVPA